MDADETSHQCIPWSLAGVVQLQSAGLGRGREKELIQRWMLPLMYNLPICTNQRCAQTLDKELNTPCKVGIRCP